MLAPNSILRGRYRIVQLIGKGGMGAVYEAIDQTFENVVAIKQMLLADDHLRKAFEREARLLNRLRHRALPVVMDYFFEGEGEFLVMQFIQGDDLGAMMKKRTANEYPPGAAKPFEVDSVLNWADQLLDALDYLHTQNPPILHRDIKPQNLKLNERGEIILLDFGLAKGATAGQSTAFTSIYGYTPSYAPLEQIQGSGTSTRSDLYSLAATLYNLLTGATPADALTRATAAVSGKSDPLKPIHSLNAKVSESLSAVLMNALSQNPELRPVGADDLRKALRNAPRLPATPTPSAEKEKKLRGNRIVVQLKTDDTLGQKAVEDAKTQQNKPLKNQKRGGAKAEPELDTQATLVRPKKEKTNLRESVKTKPEANPEQNKKTKDSNPQTLTYLGVPRQDILELLIAGYDDAEIANSVLLRESDIAIFFAELRRDTQIYTRKDLSLWAMRQGFTAGAQKSAGTQSRKEATTNQKQKQDTKVAGKSVEPAIYIPPPPPPPVQVETRRQQEKLDNSGLIKPQEKKIEPKPAEQESETSALGNFVGAIVLGFFAIGAFLTVYQEFEKGHTKSVGEIFGVIVLGVFALGLGIACLGSILNFFSALSKK
jgi:serine/threonine protein kinase